jgi:hypothetical protein
VAVSQCGQQVIYPREILRNFGFTPIGPNRIYEDNVACVAMSENPVRRKYSRHIDIRRYFVRDLVSQQVIKLVPLRTGLMVVDALTKSLPRSSTCQTSRCNDWPRSILCSHIAPIQLCDGWMILAGQGESSFSCVCPLSLHFCDIRTRGRAILSGSIA